MVSSNFLNGMDDTWYPNDFNDLLDKKKEKKRKNKDKRSKNSYRIAENIMDINPRCYKY